VTPSTGGILLVDDHELVRLGFRALVESRAMVPGQSPMVLFEAHTLAEALTLYREHHARIAVVVLDLNLPDSDGLGGLVAFRRHFPTAAVVVLSGTDHPATVQSALALGAVAFFSKSGDLGNMVGFVHVCLLHGPEAARQRLPPATAFAGIGSATDAGEFAPIAGQTLSTRQLQILQWLLQGKSNREISQLALLSEGTVKNHVSTLLLSFGVRSRAQLISKLHT
jgi:DNA-binding NarL/FixJ family response regulator